MDKTFSTETGDAPIPVPIPVSCLRLRSECWTLYESLTTRLPSAACRQATSADWRFFNINNNDKSTKVNPVLNKRQAEKDGWCNTSSFICRDIWSSRVRTTLPVSLTATLRRAMLKNFRLTHQRCYVLNKIKV